MGGLQEAIFLEKKLMDFLAKLEMGFQSVGEIHYTARLAPGMPAADLSVRIGAPRRVPVGNGQELLALDAFLPTRRGEFVPGGRAAAAGPRPAPPRSWGQSAPRFIPWRSPLL